MGQGDKKTPYRPSYEPVRCDVTGKMFRSSMVRKCRDEAVVKRYGVGGEVNVCMWVCAKCKHAVRYEFHGGISCGLDK